MFFKSVLVLIGFRLVNNTKKEKKGVSDGFQPMASSSADLWPLDARHLPFFLIGLGACFSPDWDKPFKLQK